MVPVKSTVQDIESMLKYQKLGDVKQLSQQKNEQKLRETAQDFESLFVQQMLAQMRNSVESSGLLPESQGEGVFKSMLDEKYAQMISKKGNLGLGEAMYRQLKQQFQKKS